MNDEARTQLFLCMAEVHRQLATMAELLASDSPAVQTTPGGPLLVPQQGTQPERVLAYLRQRPDGCATRQELARAFADLNDNSLSGAITRLKDRGQLESLGRGRYRLVARRGR